MSPKLALALYAGVLIAASWSVRAQDRDTQGVPGHVYRIGYGVTAPRLVFQKEPEFSEKARRAHYQGTCILKLVVGENGTPRNISVAKPLGMGLDEKAVEAVQTWKFDPAHKDGQPVAVELSVEVSFHLYGKNDQKIAELTRSAAAGNAQAQLELASFYFQGKDVGKR
jgi:TonB family protein